MSLVALLLGRARPGLWTVQTFGPADRVRAADLDRPVVETLLPPADDKEALLATVASDLNLPDYFGGNWDALADSLDQWAIDNADVIWVVHGADRLAPPLESTAQTFLDVISDVFTNPDRSASCVLVGLERGDIADLSQV